MTHSVLNARRDWGGGRLKTLIWFCVSHARSDGAIHEYSRFMNEVGQSCKTAGGTVASPFDAICISLFLLRLPAIYSAVFHDSLVWFSRCGRNVFQVKDTLGSVPKHDLQYD